MEQGVEAYSCSVDSEPEPLEQAAQEEISLDFFSAGDGPEARQHASSYLRNPAIGWLASSGSLILHGCFAAVLLYHTVPETGIAQQPTQAVSLEVALVSQVEQSEISASDAPTATNSAVAATEGSEVEALAASETVEEVKAEETTAATPELAELPERSESNAGASVISGAGPEADLPVSELETEEFAPKAAPSKKIEKEEPVETPARPKAEDKPAPKPTPKPQAKVAARQPDKGEQRETQQKGGQTSRSSAAQAGKGGRASASAGSIMGYAAQVRARVARNSPSGAGARGTAVVSFGVTSSGGLAYARLSRSSGVSSLDSAAVSAVRRAAPFPKPPAGASSSQLSFSVPFHFR